MLQVQVRFLSDEQLRWQWERNVDRQGWVSHHSSRLCSAHFESRYLYCSGRLQNGAVPTIYNFEDELWVKKFQSTQLLASTETVNEPPNKTTNHNTKEPVDMTSSRPRPCCDDVVIVLSSDDECDDQSRSTLPQWEHCRPDRQSSPSSHRLVVGNDVDGSSDIDPEIMEFYCPSEKSEMVKQRLLEAAKRLFGENDQQQMTSGRNDSFWQGSQKNDATRVNESGPCDTIDQTEDSSLRISSVFSLESFDSGFCPADVFDVDASLIELKSEKQSPPKEMKVNEVCDIRQQTRSINSSESSRCDENNGTNRTTITPAKPQQSNKLLSPASASHHCASCDKAFRWSSGLRKHVRKHHANERPFRCDVCGAAFRIEYFLSRHIRARHRGAGEVQQQQQTQRMETPLPFQCDQCGRSCSSSKQLSQHRRQTHCERKYFCTVCDKAFKSSSNLKKHSRSHSNERPFRRSDAAYVTKQSVTSHIRAWHNGAGEVLQQQQQQQAQRKAQPLPYQCNRCGRSYNSPTQLSFHRRTHGERINRCTVCGKAFLSSSALSEHARYHTGERPPFQCSVCDEAFVSKQHAASHVCAMHKSAGEVQQLPLPFQCTQCKWSFSSSRQLSKHEQRVHGERKYSCTVCKMTFSSPRGLSQHVGVHERPFQCGVCDAAFSTKQNATRHIRTRHNGAGEVKQQQQQTQRTVKPLPFQCNQCNRSYCSSAQLSFHRRTHGERKYRCTVCGKAYVHSSALCQHARIHTGERPFQCGVCDAAFISKENATRHIRVLHECAGDPSAFLIVIDLTQKKLSPKNPPQGKAGAKRGLLSAPAVSPKSKTSVGDCGLFNCVICGKVCSTAAELKEHAKTVHSHVRSSVATNEAGSKGHATTVDEAPSVAGVEGGKLEQICQTWDQRCITDRPSAFKCTAAAASSVCTDRSTAAAAGASESSPSDANVMTMIKTSSSPVAAGRRARFTGSELNSSSGLASDDNAVGPKLQECTETDRGQTVVVAQRASFSPVVVKREVIDDDQVAEDHLGTSLRTQGNDDDDGGLVVCRICRQTFKRVSSLMTHMTFYHNEQSFAGETLSSSPMEIAVDSRATSRASHMTSIGNFTKSPGDCTTSSTPQKTKLATDDCSETVPVTPVNSVTAKKSPAKVTSRTTSDNQTSSKQKKPAKKPKSSARHTLVGKKSPFTTTSAAPTKGRKRCAKCGKVLSSMQRLRAHDIIVHQGTGAVDETGDRPDIKPPPRYWCNHCCKYFAYISDLIPHLRIHSGENPYRCNRCGVTFKMRTAFNKHRCHNDDNDNCHGANPASTATSRAVKRQPLKPSVVDNVIHNNNDDVIVSASSSSVVVDMQYSCNVCQQSFSKRQQLVDHVRLLHGLAAVAAACAFAKGVATIDVAAAADCSREKVSSACSATFDQKTA